MCLVLWHLPQWQSTCPWMSSQTNTVKITCLSKCTMVANCNNHIYTNTQVSADLGLKGALKIKTELTESLHWLDISIWRLKKLLLHGLNGNNSLAVFKSKSLPANLIKTTPFTVGEAVTTVTTSYLSIIEIKFQVELNIAACRPTLTVGAQLDAMA